MPKARCFFGGVVVEVCGVCRDGGSLVMYGVRITLGFELAISTRNDMLSSPLSCSLSMSIPSLSRAFLAVCFWSCALFRFSITSTP